MCQPDDPMFWALPYALNTGVRQKFIVNTWYSVSASCQTFRQPVPLITRLLRSSLESVCSIIRSKQSFHQHTYQACKEPTLMGHMSNITRDVPWSLSRNNRAQSISLQSAHVELSSLPRSPKVRLFNAFVHKSLVMPHLKVRQYVNSRSTRIHDGQLATHHQIISEV